MSYQSDLRHVIRNTWRKNKVSLCENCQRQSCKAFIVLTIHAKIIGGGRPLLPEILDQTDRDGAKSPIFDSFSPVVQCLSRNIYQKNPIKH